MTKADALGPGICSQPTYEGLKPALVGDDEVDGDGSQPTYEGLKHVPPVKIRTLGLHRSQPTYEGLKHGVGGEGCAAWRLFPAYL